MFKGFFAIPFILLVFSCASTASQSTVRTGNMPAWVNDVYSVYDRNQYVAATGFSEDRATAEGNALGALAAFFGQSVQIERTAASTYQQAVVNGTLASWASTAEMRSDIRTIVSMDNLMAVEIKEVWFDSRGIYYALAVMEKARAIQAYSNLLRANLNIINNLVTMPLQEKNTINGFIRYWFASAVADVNESYRNLLVLLDANTPSVISGDLYRLEAQNIIKAIPIGIRVDNDRNGRITGAFSRCFSIWGFETTTSNTRYVLDVSVNLTPVNLPQNPNLFSRVEVSAALRDTNLNLVLVPYNFNSREGSISQIEADNRAIAAAERDINQNFNALLAAYLSQLIPKT